jgi:AbrB family looped-hinge helix DNA binding protein
MSKASTLTSKGQVTVPLEVRRRLGLRPGDRVEFVTEGERTVVRRESGPANPFERYKGALGPFPGGRAGLKKWLSELRDDEECRA